MILVHHSFHVDAAGAALGLLRAVSESFWMGVNLFFVLSGFLIGGILLDSRGEPGYFRTFYARRALRIFPLYYAFLLAFFFVVTPLSGWLGHPLPRVEDKAPYFLYYANFGSRTEGPIPRSIHPLWSLAVEEQIYLIWPALIALTPRRHLARVLVALFGVSLVWRVGVLAAHRSISWAYGWTPACLDAFAAGTLAAMLARSGEDRAALRATAARWLAGSGLFLAGLVIGLENFFFWKSPKAVLTAGLTGLSILFAATILYLVTSPTTAWPNRLLGARWLRQVGKYSYAMYLFHAPVDGLIRALTDSRLELFSGYRSLAAQAVNAVVVLVLSYGLAAASWRFLERPFLSLKRYFPTSGRGVPSLASDARAPVAAEIPAVPVAEPVADLA
jgi:peptidoglycan/LPS O-acetylase OafA/YrhL